MCQRSPSVHRSLPIQRVVFNLLPPSARPTDHHQTSLIAFGEQQQTTAPQSFSRIICKSLPNHSQNIDPPAGPEAEFNFANGELGR